MSFDPNIGPVEESRQPMDLVDRQRWLDIELARAKGIFQDKFEKGQAEHNSDIGEMQLGTLLDQMEQEAIDFYWYVREARRRLRRLTHE